MRDEIERAIDAIRGDHEHGASFLAQRGADLLEWITRAGLDGDQAPDATIADLSAACRDLAAARPGMAAILVVACHVAAAVAGPGDAATALRRVRAAIERLRSIWLDAPVAIARHLGALLGVDARVLTLSRSATVTAALVANRDAIASLTVLESRPGGEGVMAARDLAAQGVALVTLVPDAAVALAMASTTCAVVGTDAILSEGWAVNKTGTAPLAGVAHALGVPVYVVSETLKIAPAGWVWRPETFDPALLLPQPMPGVTAQVVPFERLPLDLVTLVTERGPLDRAAIATIAAALDEGFTRIMSDWP